MSEAGNAGPPAAALAAVPGLAAGARPLACERLAGGTVNDSWLVQTGAGRFVLRLDGAAWRRPGVERGRELLLHERAAAAGLAPRILRSLPQQGVLVCEYLPGADWLAEDLADPAHLMQLGERLAMLHALPAPQLPVFAPLAIFDDYLARCAPQARAEGGALRAALAQAQRQVEAAARVPCIVHGDLVHTNLRSGAALWLLDWEYAQVGDPAWDLGCVLAYYPGALAWLEPMLAAAQLPGAAAGVLAAAEVYRLLTWAWHRARGEAAEPPAALREPHRA
jgi:thiamine kinase-like enzyme